MTTSDLSVAETILAQLGGNRFRAMTGANGFIGSESTLSFKIPTHNGINGVLITLEPSDTYKVEFISVRRKGFDIVRKVKSTYHEVYAEDLQNIFTKETGLYTRL